MTQHIGIVACSFEGAALCYRSICLEAAKVLGPHAHPEVSLHNHQLLDYLPPLDAGDTKAVADLMLSSAHKLARAGADFLICPDNTIHQAMAHVLPRSPLPWLHIAEEVAEEAKRRGFKRIGITGTAWLVNSNVYPDAFDKHGMQWMRPETAERDEIARIIMEELVRGVQSPEAVAYFQRVMSRMQADGCDAVVLGCTEIPLIMHDGNSPLPTLDSTALLAQAAVRRAVQGHT